MSKISAGNRLYLYRLMLQGLGLGRQATLARVEELLTQDGIWPEDLGCDDMRSLMEELGDFVKVTAFKKGSVYATVLANEEFDRALAAASDETKAPAGGKSWKKKRGAKGIKPIKPRHIQKPVAEAAPSASAGEKPSGAEGAPDGAGAAAAAGTAGVDGGTGSKSQAAGPNSPDGSTDAAAVAEATGAAAADAPVAMTIAELMAKAAAEEAKQAADQAAVAPEPEAGTTSGTVEVTAVEAGQALGRVVAASASQRVAAIEATEVAAAEAGAEHESPDTPSVAGATAGPDVPAPNAPVTAATAGDATATHVTPSPDATPEPAQATAAAPSAAAPSAAAPEPPAAPHTPSINLTITYVPEPAADSATAPASPGTRVGASAANPPVNAASHPAGGANASAPAARHASKPHAFPTHAPRARTDLPQDFYADVRCPNEPLSALYQILPPEVDPMAVLEEDFRAARSTGTLKGSRSSVTFSLRFLRPDGSGEHVTATLRRSARATGGKYWTLDSIDAGEPVDVGFGGLTKPTGPWSAFFCSNEQQFRESVDAALDLAQTVVLGSWETVLDQLGSLAAPEDWGLDQCYLRDYLVLAFARIRARGLLAVSEDGSSASFDTGLFTADDLPIIARLAATGSDIPWKLEGFAAESAPATPALRFDGSVDPELAGLPARVVRNPRVATLAYDALADQTWVLVPAASCCAQALLPTAEGYEPGPVLNAADAYACARVVSEEQPSWLHDAVLGHRLAPRP